MRRRFAAAAALAVLAAGCVSGPSGSPSAAPSFPEPEGLVSSGEAVSVDAPAAGATATVWHTEGATVPGVVALDVRPVAVELGAPAAWLLAAPTADGGTLWVAVHDDGAVTAVTIGQDGRVAAADVGAATVPIGNPPALHAPSGTWELAEPPQNTAENAGVLPLGDGRLVTVTADGDLLVTAARSDFPDTYPGPYLPDARPVRVDDRRVALLYQPSDRYGHGVLGDAVEARQVRIVDVTSGSVTDTVVPEGRVIEGVRPLIGDLTGDGETDLVITTSADADGARLEAWLLAGRGRRIGPAIGTSGRWRHQIAIAPTGADGGTEIVEVVTPHLRRTATFWRPTDQILTATGDADDAVISHTIGSRSMEDVAVVDLDGDGQRELVGPGVNGGVAVIRHGADDTTVEVLDLPTPASNLALVAVDGDRAALGYVTADGLLLTWVGAA